MWWTSSSPLIVLALTDRTCWKYIIFVMSVILFVPCRNIAVLHKLNSFSSLWIVPLLLIALKKMFQWGHGKSVWVFHFHQVLDIRILFCLFSFVCEGQGTSPGFWNQCGLESSGNNQICFNNKTKMIPILFFLISTSYSCIQKKNIFFLLSIFFRFARGVSTKTLSTCLP